ncbi:MAG TPA: hypothetical protein VEX18_13645 [Polyangiaceae bacterium]|nr:hypothetical protein [Polyangiaceae bacterium]
MADWSRSLVAPRGSAGLGSASRRCPRSIRGVAIASLLLTAAAIIAAGGLAAARDPSRRVNIGLWLPIAAALPLFGVFYAIGLFIFEHLGQTYAGVLLIAVALLGALASVFAASNRHTEARR